MTVVRVSPKGQILIPKRIREKLEVPESILIKKAPEDPISAACGFLEGSFSLTDDLIKEHRKELENDRHNCPR
jgi:AbrB family looped-hinge helix DNA binding protein